MFDENFNFGGKFQFLTKILMFDHNFDFLPNIYFYVAF